MLASAAKDLEATNGITKIHKRRVKTTATQHKQRRFLPAPPAPNPHVSPCTYNLQLDGLALQLNGADFLCLL